MWEESTRPSQNRKTPVELENPRDFHAFGSLLSAARFGRLERLRYALRWGPELCGPWLDQWAEKLGEDRLYLDLGHVNWSAPIVPGAIVRLETVDPIVHVNQVVLVGLVATLNGGGDPDHPRGPFALVGLCRDAVAHSYDDASRIPSESLLISPSPYVRSVDVGPWVLAALTDRGSNGKARPLFIRRDFRLSRRMMLR